MSAIGDFTTLSKRIKEGQSPKKAVKGLFPSRRVRKEARRILEAGKPLISLFPLYAELGRKEMETAENEAIAKRADAGMVFAYCEDGRLKALRDWRRFSLKCDHAHIEGIIASRGIPVMEKGERAVSLLFPKDAETAPLVIELPKRVCVGKAAKDGLMRLRVFSEAMGLETPILRDFPAEDIM